MVLLQAGTEGGREGGTALMNSIFDLDWCKPEAVTCGQLPLDLRESQHAESLSLGPLSYKVLQINTRCTKKINLKIAR